MSVHKGYTELHIFSITDPF